MIERIFVFADNGGLLLKDCVDSIFRHFEQAKVTIMQNRSDDPETKAVLSSFRLRANIVNARKRKGRYPSREFAWQSIGNDEFFLFVRDDAQFVRKFESEDFNYMRSYFYNNPNAAFLCPLFLQNRRAWDPKSIRLYENFYSHYEYDLSECLLDKSIPMYFADTFIGRSSVLRNSDWSFKSESRSANAIEARKHFQKMGHMINPVCALSPSCSLMRNRLALRCRLLKALKRFVRVRRYRYRDLSPGEVNKLRRRDPVILPFEKRFLTRVDANYKEPTDARLAQESPLPRRL